MSIYNVVYILEAFSIKFILELSFCRLTLQHKWKMHKVYFYSKERA